MEDNFPVPNAKVVLEIREKGWESKISHLKVVENGEFKISKKLFFEKHPMLGYRTFIITVDAEDYKHKEVEAHSIDFKGHLYYPRDKNGNIFLLILMEKG